MVFFFFFFFLAGTPLYVAPELVTNGPTTHACDVYSFGIMGYVFIAKKRPYDDRPDLPEDIAEFLGCIVEGVRPWVAGEAKHDFPPGKEEKVPKKKVFVFLISVFFCRGRLSLFAQINAHAMLAA